MHSLFFKPWPPINDDGFRHLHFYTRGIDMKADTHPDYNEVSVKCSCGNAFSTRSTYGKDEMSIDVCSECHPFYTGKQKILDTAGQIDKFNKRFGNK